MTESLIAKKLTCTFFARDTITVARELLGKFLVHNDNGVNRIGKIVEVEAYLGAHDLASHSSRGHTPRTSVLFGPVGHAYVYLIYGMYDCFNIVTGEPGKGAAVLIRAVEPVQQCLGKTSGPGLLCRALAIDRKHNGHDLQGDELFIASPAANPAALKIMARPRIGVDYAGHWRGRLLRFYIRGNPYISKK